MPPPQILIEWTPSKIVAMRQAMELTQKAFGEKVYASQRTIKRWEAGDTAPWPNHRQRLQEIFNTQLTADQAQAVIDAA